MGGGCGFSFLSSSARAAIGNAVDNFPCARYNREKISHAAIGEISAAFLSAAHTLFTRRRYCKGMDGSLRRRKAPFQNRMIGDAPFPNNVQSGSPQKSGGGVSAPFKNNTQSGSPQKSGDGRKALFQNKIGAKALFQNKIGSRACVFWGLAACTALVYLLADIPVSAEYLFARGVTRALSWILGGVTGLFSLSFYETAAALLIVGIPMAAVCFILLLCWKDYARAKAWLWRAAFFALSLLLSFGLLFAPLYARPSAASALGIEEAPVTRSEVAAAADWTIGQLNELAAQLPRDEAGDVLPADFEALARSLNAAYAEAGSYFAPYAVRPKAVALSVPMSYLGITGIYMPFFAEANVNVNIPAYTLPVTMAHEMAHAKGVAQEGQANIVAYALCLRSEEAALRYSGLMSAAAALLNALPQAEIVALHGQICSHVRRQYADASAHYHKYEGLIDSISSFFNDLFLKANGVPGGIESYGSTVRALVSLQKQLSAG